MLTLSIKQIYMLGQNIVKSNCSIHNLACSKSVRFVHRSFLWEIHTVTRRKMWLATSRNWDKVQAECGIVKDT